MNLLNDIEKYLAIFQLQVKISTNNSQYDINIHAETVLIPLLNVAYDADFENANVSEKKNAEAIDLIDTKKRIAVQVTSSYRNDKVKSTLEKFMKSKFRTKVDTVYIYILTEKQRFYSQAPLTKIAGKTIAFDASKHIIDASGLFARIKSITDNDILKSVKELLRKEFSDYYLSESFSGNDFLIFRESYKKACVANFTRLNFFGLSVAKKPREVGLYNLFVLPRLKAAIDVSLEKTYSDYAIQNIVELSLRGTKTKSKIPKETIEAYFDMQNFEIKKLNNHHLYDFNELLSIKKNIVLLGNPGAGKSSIVKYAICKILDQDKEVFNNQLIYDYLPFRIELHKYNLYRGEKHLGILDYLVQMLLLEFQLEIHREDLHRILRNFKVLMFFDGLDEIFDIQERLQVRNDIENLLRLYSEMKGVVTSRYESYEEVSLDKKLFETLEVLNFDDDQVKDYVVKWYKVEEGNPDIRLGETESCIKQLTSVESELKYNPLLLSLILILYRNELEIPTSKLEIYENCTNTIVEHRDTKEKKINFNLSVINPIAVFSSLAYWQFTQEKQLSVNFNDVHSFIKHYLLGKKEFDDESLAKRAADQFLDFAKVRSVYFENKFTHKTFLEYFSAYYLFSHYYSKPHNIPILEEIIAKHIGLSSWAVVLELLICKIDNSQIDFEIIDQMVDRQFEINSLNTTLFFLQVIKYLKNISPAKNYQIVKEGMKICLGVSDSQFKAQSVNIEIIFSHLVALSQLSRFEIIIRRVFEELLMIDKVSEIELAVFAYEFTIVSENDFLVSLIDGRQNLQSEYLTVLKNYSKILRSQSYYEWIKEIVDTKSIDVRKTFHSKFAQPIFNGSTKFNIIISYLLSNRPELLEFSYKSLKSIGLSDDDMRLSLTETSAEIYASEYDLTTLLQTAADNSFKKFTRKVIKAYYPKADQNSNLKSDKFYDYFFKKQF